MMVPQERVMRIEQQASIPLNERTVLSYARALAEFIDQYESKGYVFDSALSTVAIWVFLFDAETQLSPSEYAVDTPISPEAVATAFVNEMRAQQHSYIQE
ncbi:hypothetical protein C5B42_01575 [Candidatus Cerribacteria bacterium 'Amazon FNV 2010 28 9']|uniref:Uncharacterized protein n=1 Tax=Candidatus Cerribacteria bacterium 'Amazon FNV 2010 28 9' TaxID=2081795 RepID=A0A317JPP9_9BACT|nr:MAG: hypothetical protein C5B42_01575 [Candidatus Cerribacteria bacterium 'Amazon FNV 2010 28 9']